MLLGIFLYNGTMFYELKNGTLVETKDAQGNFDLTQVLGNKYLEDVLLSYLYKTSVEFKSDINGIGKYALSEFFTNNEFTNYNWVNNYTNSTFKVTVNTTVSSGFLLNKT